MNWLPKRRSSCRSISPTIPSPRCGRPRELVDDPSRICTWSTSCPLWSRPTRA